MTKSLRAFVLCAVAITACNWGTRVKDFQPAWSPVGADVAVRSYGSNADRVGELFVVDDSGVVINEFGRLSRVRWVDLAAMDVDKLDRTYDFRGAGAPPTAEHRARLAAVSRFPQGLTPELRAKLLTHFHQDSIFVVPRASLDSLATRAAVAAQRYADRRAAIADGYRRVGTDFPGMGEHWLRTDALLSNRVEAERPTMLTYATIEGKAKLLGFGFLTTTVGDTAVPAVPGWPEHWHEHSGFLAEESGAIRADGESRKDGTRIWVLHVWSVLENPEGRYVANNWALPFARAGLEFPRDVDASSAQGLSLAVGGDEFLRSVLTEVGARTDVNASAVDSAIEAQRINAARVVEAMRQRAVTSSDLAELRTSWQRLSTALGAIGGPRVASMFAPQHRHYHGAGEARHASP